MCGMLSASSSVPSISFGSRIAVKPSTKLPTPASSARLTAETLRRHNVGTKSNAATRRKSRDVHSQPSVTSSMGNISSAAEDLPHWLESNETWTVEIRPWNSADVCMEFKFGWKRGENQVSLGQVVHQMQEKLGER